MSNKALTLEELRQMDGKPVYYKTAKMWFIVALNHPDFGDCAINVSGQYIPLKKAERQNRFYAAEPPHLDRSAWELCEKCRSCRTCIHAIESMSDSTGTCFWCDYMDKYKPMNFCPECGRPLTDAAWEMLEKRLEGAK